MLPWQPFLAFYIWCAHWRHLKNTTEPSMCGGDAALCQITLTTCYILTAEPRSERILKIVLHLRNNHGRGEIVGLIFLQHPF